MTRHRPVYDEERAPCGDAGALSFHFTMNPSDIADCRAVQPWTPRRWGERRLSAWNLVIWEPLLTKAPRPPKAQPFCCYVDTVIFYHFPYIEGWRRPWRDRDGRWRPSEVGAFVEWDRIETRFTWEDLVRFDGQVFAIGGGRALWKQGRWVRTARRQEDTAPARERAY